MAKNPHKPFKVVTTDDGETILQCTPIHDTTMVVRKPIPAKVDTIATTEPKVPDLIAPKAVNEPKIKPIR